MKKYFFSPFDNPPVINQELGSVHTNWDFYASLQSLSSLTSHPAVHQRPHNPLFCFSNSTWRLRLTAPSPKPITFSLGCLKIIPPHTSPSPSFHSSPILEITNSTFCPSSSASKNNFFPLDPIFRPAPRSPFPEPTCPLFALQPRKIRTIENGSTIWGAQDVPTPELEGPGLEKPDTGHGSWCTCVKCEAWWVETELKETEGREGKLRGLKTVCGGWGDDEVGLEGD